MRLRRRFLMPTCTVLAACANGRVRDAVVAHGTNETDAPLRRVRFVMYIPYISIAFTFWSVRTQRMVAAHSEQRGARVAVLHQGPQTSVDNRREYNFALTEATYDHKERIQES